MWRRWLGWKESPEQEPRQGVDEFPDRFYKPTTDGALADLDADRSVYDKAMKYYYALMGWDTNGVPLPEKVEELF